MKSIKNHISLVIALMSILFSLQIFVITDRAIDSYKENLSKNYSVVVVSKKIIHEQDMLNIDSLLKSVSELAPDEVIARLNTGIGKKNIELLKLTLPKFYKIKLKIYPTPAEIEKLTQKFLLNKSIIKVETFTNNLDNIYKLLLLFKNIVTVFSISIFIVTTLLIIKELRIWQFQHSERMNIMRLFGAPSWLRSGILFRLAITDAIIASILIFIIFIYFSSSKWILHEFSDIGITLTVFYPLNDFLYLLGVAVTLATILAALIVMGHKEEV